MKICVCGWYFNPEFMRQLELVHKKYPVVVVSHRNRPIRLPHVYIPNVGLEWGAYNYYLKYIYDGKGKVLFTHDDNDVEDVSVFDELAKCDLDVGFVFRNEAEAEWAFDRHGRAIVMSEKFLNFCKKEKFSLVNQESGERFTQDGFWYDKKNFGYVGDDKKLNCNKGIEFFASYLKYLEEKDYGFKVGTIFNDRLKLGFRGDRGIEELAKSIRALKKSHLKWSDMPDRIRL
jgi:hypothetical protein